MGPERAHSGTRVLLLGAETEVGRAIAEALAAGAALLSLVATSPDAETAFAVQRLGRRLNAVAQAIDAGNEMAVRVMVRQVAKELGGLDAVVFCAGPGTKIQSSLELALRFGGREMARAGGGVFVAALSDAGLSLGGPAAGVEAVAVAAAGRDPEDVAREVLGHVAGAPHNG